MFRGRQRYRLAGQELPSERCDELVHHLGGNDDTGGGRAILARVVQCGLGNLVRDRFDIDVPEDDDRAVAPEFQVQHLQPCRTRDLVSCPHTARQRDQGRDAVCHHVLARLATAEYGVDHTRRQCLTRYRQEGPDTARSGGRGLEDRRIAHRQCRGEFGDRGRQRIVPGQNLGTYSEGVA
ncbi:Uncharacterised protein [Mycobacteroides abscessus subsp. massiliense]|nr:Uncharacterised protein [Mycobacteroides abscessus subsp. massiliense]